MSTKPLSLICAAAALACLSGLAGPPANAGETPAAPPARAANSGEASPRAEAWRATLDEANAAFTAGDHEKALPLYRSVLEQDPRNLQALRRAGLLLGWAGKPDDAASLLGMAVRLDPADRDTRRQLARVQSWGGHYEASLQSYDALLKDDPSDTATAVERARVLSWASRLQDSEKAYRAVLMSDPGNTEATLGLAQCLGWQGRLDESAHLYEEVLPRDPTQARLGLGRVSLWRGDTAGALRAARTELAADPANKEALDLRRAALQRTRPSLTANADVSSDTDQNRTISGGATGHFHPGGVVDVDVNLTQMNEQGFDLEAQRFNGLSPDGAGTPVVTGGDELQDLTATVLGATAGFRLGGNGRMTVGAAIEHLGSYKRSEPLPDRDSATEMSGFAAYKLTTSPIAFRFALATEIPKWTAYITENDLRWNHLTATLNGPLPWELSWSATFDGGQITGGEANNDRSLVVARAWRSFDLGGPTIVPRYAFRFMAYDLNLLDGYFDPQHYTSNTIGADLNGKFHAGRFEWGVSADLGLETFRFDEEDGVICEVFTDPADVSACKTRTPVPGSQPGADTVRAGSSESGHNTVVGLAGRMTWNVRDRLSFDATASWNNSAAQSASGYTSRSFGLVARIGF